MITKDILKNLVLLMKNINPINNKGKKPTACSITANAWDSTRSIKKYDVKIYTAAAWYVPRPPGAAGIARAKDVDISIIPTPIQSIEILVAKITEYVTKK